MDSKRTVIAFDMDDVLVDLLDEWVYALNLINRGQPDVKTEEITDWDISQFFPELSKKDIFSILESPFFWYRVKSKPNVEETINHLKGLGYRVVVATASHIKTIQSKIENCLFRLYDCFDDNDIIMIQDKSLLKADYLIDDNPDNFKGFTGVRILMDSPHNQNPPPYSFDYRIKDISECIQYIEHHESYK